MNCVFITTTYQLSLTTYQRVIIYFKTIAVRSLGYAGRYNGGVFFI